MSRSVAEKEALEWLLAQAMAVWGRGPKPELEKNAEFLAVTLSVVSATSSPSVQRPLVSH